MPKVIIDNELCKGCELCVSACPKKIIKLDKKKTNSKGYHPASVEDMNSCTGCGSCTLMCPDVAIQVEV